ncbi:branched chain amino acid ABC transporter substrate-binding protein [Frankia sp. CcI156]|uniref:branched-chain amino acid ABC transporter substrate-binding protein n=1 Tax=unclassified Frankia TaxID=2632575 RepID=UPI0003CFC96B|nr:MULTISPECIES: branched-chain amino acid ABC transporter substrate-binding protein [unclassified Frankia]ETA02290.1 amino acid/amide ABC transporter substrate-binding protein, HAAT family [Frankia sp. CcI6]OHV54760.1 branched chain amino acid ABC transporter substrate-binding protein [Frankia sp. CgIS1]ONH26189.1 branched chain amino acid ABC transporter substrate-binding protein [Frankia sp. CcI156]
MGRRPLLGAIALAATVALTAAACGSDSGSSSNGKQTITIGFQGVLSGDSQQLGLNALYGVRTAIAEVNADASAPFQLKLVESDDGGSPDQGPTAAQKLIDDSKVVAVVGPMFSGATKASEPAYTQAGLLSVSPSATNPALTTLGFKTFYRVIAPDTVQGKAAADYIATVLKATKVYSLDDKSEYGTGLSGALEAELKAKGVNATHDGINPTKDYTSEATKIIAAAPEVLYYSGYYPEFALLSKALKGKGFTGKIISGDGSLDPQYVAQAGAAAAEGAYLTCPCGDANTDPKAASFVASYKKVNNGTKPGTYSGEAYDATLALADVFKKLGKDVTRESVTGAFGSVNFPGITKTVVFEPNGEVKGSNVFVYQVKGGQITVLGNIANLVKA